MSRKAAARLKPRVFFAGCVAVAVSLVVVGVVPAQARPARPFTSHVSVRPSHSPPRIAPAYADLPGQLFSTVTSSSSDPLHPLLTSGNSNLRAIGNFFLSVESRWNTCRDGGTRTLLRPLFSGETATGTEKIHFGGLTAHHRYRLHLTGPSGNHASACQFTVTLPAGHLQIPLPGGRTINVDIPSNKALTIHPDVRPGVVQLSAPGFSQTLAMNGSLSNPLTVNSSGLDVSLTSRYSQQACITQTIAVYNLFVATAAMVGATIGGVAGLVGGVMTGPFDPDVAVAGAASGAAAGMLIAGTIGIYLGLAVGTVNVAMGCFLFPQATQVTPSLAVATP